MAVDFCDVDRRQSAAVCSIDPSSGSNESLDTRQVAMTSCLVQGRCTVITRSGINKISTIHGSGINNMNNMTQT